MHILKLKVAARKSDAISEGLWTALAGSLEGIEELPADGGAFFKTGADFEILEFGSEAAKQCAVWLEQEKFRGDDTLIFQLYLNRLLMPDELTQLEREQPGIEILSQLELPGVDYLDEYKKRVRGQRLSDAIWVGPPWDSPPTDSTYNFIVDPGLAFGTGEHPTTQLCLLRLLELKREGFAPTHILDLGTGTGVLALAAKWFFPHAALVVTDLDPACENEVAKTFAANQTPMSALVTLYGTRGTASSLRRSGLSFDFIISNIYAEVLASAAPDIYALGRPNSKWLASGILAGPSESALDEATPSMFNCALRRTRSVEKPELTTQSGLQNAAETWVLKEWQRRG